MLDYAFSVDLLLKLSWWQVSISMHFERQTKSWSCSEIFCSSIQSVPVLMCLHMSVWYFSASFVSEYLALDLCSRDWLGPLQLGAMLKEYTFHFLWIALAWFVCSFTFSDAVILKKNISLTMTRIHTQFVELVHWSFYCYFQFLARHCDHKECIEVIQGRRKG
jgi:hypothetical protein